MGTARRIVAAVMYFITLERLLLMSEANVSIVPFSTVAWIVAVSSACWYSTAASSSTSRSSSVMFSWRAWSRRFMRMLSAFSDVEK